MQPETVAKQADRLENEKPVNQKVSLENSQSDRNGSGTPSKGDESHPKAKFTKWVFLFWEYLKLTVYQGREYDAKYEREAKKVIWNGVFGGFNADFSDEEWQEFYNECIARMELVQHYVNQAPETRFIPHPKKFFDPSFTKGFIQTNEWLRKVRIAKYENHCKDLLRQAIESLKKGKAPSNLKEGKDWNRIQLFQYWQIRMERLQNQPIMQAFTTACAHPDVIHLSKLKPIRPKKTNAATRKTTRTSP